MKTAGTISIIRNDPVTIHSYMSPPDGVLVCSQVIETENKIVLVDALLTRPYAKELRSYVESLNKPLDRIFITHTHPDHWLGLEFFDDVPIYALPETKYIIEENGPQFIQVKKMQLGDLVADIPVAPTHVVEEGTTTIDGVTFVFTKIADAETDFALLIELPDQNTLVAQDLVYNNVHVFFGEEHFDGWINVLEGLKAKGYGVVLPGHGEPTDATVFDSVIDYLSTAKQAYEGTSDEQELKRILLDKYPDKRVTEMIDLTLLYLYHKTW